MRQAFLAVVLIAASFAGGAFVNGPGLRWAQTTLMAKLGMEGDEETPTAVAKADDTPTDTISPLAKEPSANSTPGSSNAPTASESAKTPTAVSSLPKVAEPSAKERSVQGNALNPLDAPLALEAPTPLPSPLDADTHGPDPSISLASLSDSHKSAAVTDPKADEPPAAAASVIPGAPTTWSEVRRTLKSLGVTRYGTESDTAGRVRFFCLIPVAGRKAVGQHFEAEGDDELEAAQAAIRRIGLWRVSEEAEATPPTP